MSNKQLVMKPSSVTASLLVCFIMVVVFTVANSYAIDPSSIVGAWLFDEGSGTIAKDESQYHNDGTITDAEWVEGVFGKALKFNGNSAYVEIPLSDSLDFAGKEEITVTVWANITGAGFNSGRIVDNSPINTTWGLSKEPFDSVLWRPVTAGGWLEARSGRLEQNQWYHFGATYDGTEARLYRDGELRPIADKPGKGALQRSGMSLVIGGQTGELEGNGVPSWFDGIIDEVMIVSGVLTEAEIKEVIEKGIAAVTLSVGFTGKLTTTWGHIKEQY